MIKKIALICFLILTLLWVGFIFSNSVDTGVESTQKSSAVTDIANDLLHSLGFDGSISEKAVRTLGHFSEFFVLSVLLCADTVLYLNIFPLKWGTFSLLCVSVPFCFITACIDELIQRSSAGRAMQFSDVMTDTLGALCASLIFYLIYSVCKAIRKISKKSN